MEAGTGFRCGTAAPPGYEGPRHWLTVHRNGTAPDEGLTGLISYSWQGVVDGLLRSTTTGCTGSTAVSS